MESVNLGNHVIIRDENSRYLGNGALVVSEPFDCEIKGILTKVVAVKVFYKDWDNYGEWTEDFIIFSLSKLNLDKKHKFEISRLDVKFGRFNAVFFLDKDLDPNEECAFCQNSARKRIELNIWGTITQYDVCHSCAEKWDGKRTDGSPLKKVDESKNKKIALPV